MVVFGYSSLKMFIVFGKSIRAHISCILMAMSGANVAIKTFELPLKYISRRRKLPVITFYAFANPSLLEKAKNS